MTIDTAAGSIYIAFCPAMPGLVKVGMTTRDPNERVAELSASTGVPTPFVLIWQATVANAVSAERLAHETLATAGFNRSPNREFFAAPIDRAVELLTAAFPSRDAAIGDDREASRPTRRAADELCELAEATFDGTGETLRDEEEGRRLLRRAAALGSARACIRLARVTRKSAEVLRLLRRAVELGEPRAYADLAAYYEEKRDWDNAAKCWQRLFRESTRNASFNEAFAERAVECLASATAEYHCRALAEEILKLRPDAFTILQASESDFDPERWRWIRMAMDSTYSDSDYWMEGTVCESSDRVLAIVLNDGRRANATFARRFPVGTRLRCLVYGNDVRDVEPLWWPT